MDCLLAEWRAALTPTCVLQTHIHYTHLYTANTFMHRLTSVPVSLCSPGLLPLLSAPTLWCTFEKLPLCKGLIWVFVRRMPFIWATHGFVHKSSWNAIDTLFGLTPPLPFTHTHAHKILFLSWWGLSIHYFPLLYLYSDKTFSIPWLTPKSNPHWNIYKFLYSQII